MTAVGISAVCAEGRDLVLTAAEHDCDRSVFQPCGDNGLALENLHCLIGERGCGNVDIVDIALHDPVTDTAADIVCRKAFFAETGNYFFCIFVFKHKACVLSKQNS